MNEDLKKGDIVLVPLSYSDLVNNKLRPALVLYHDLDVMQLTVAYISSKVATNPGPYDIVIPLDTPMSRTAGLVLFVGCEGLLDCYDQENPCEKEAGRSR